MNENMKKWISALRSGEYSQAKRFLKLDGCYCCLGVLCDVFQKETGVGAWEDNENSNSIFRIKGDPYPAAKLPPNSVYDWVGLDKCAQVKDKTEVDNGLPFLNDHCNYSFDDIADCLERTYG